MLKNDKLNIYDIFKKIRKLNDVISDTSDQYLFIIDNVCPGKKNFSNYDYVPYYILLIRDGIDIKLVLIEYYNTNGIHTLSEYCLFDCYGNIHMIKGRSFEHIEYQIYFIGVLLRLLVRCESIPFDKMYVNHMKNCPLYFQNIFNKIAMSIQLEINDPDYNAWISSHYLNILKN